MTSSNGNTFRVTGHLCSEAGDLIRHRAHYDVTVMQFVFDIRYATEKVNNHTIVFWCNVNSSPPSAAYMHQWTGSALVQGMACRLFRAKPLPESMLVNCQLEFQWNSNRNSILLMQAMYLKLSGKDELSLLVMWLLYSGKYRSTSLWDLWGVTWGCPCLSWGWIYR